MALELVKDLSSKSWVSQRLWRTVKSLKAYAPRLGLQLDEDGATRRDHGSSAASLTVAGTAPQNNGHGVIDTSHRSSVSSGGPLSASSPGLTPGYGQHNHSSSRMGSLTPHAGRNPPVSAGGAGQSQGQGQSAPSPDDAYNGRRLQSEMWKMFEGFASGAVQQGTQFNGADEFFCGHMGDYSIGTGNASFGGGSGDSDGVYQYMKEMF